MKETAGEGGGAGPAWARLPAESIPAYEAFLRYRDLGPGRSLEAAAAAIRGREPGKGRGAPGRICGWSAQHAWVARASAWDAAIQQERDRAAFEEAGKWEARRQAAREKTFDMGARLMARVEEMLAHPIVEEHREERSEGGKKVTIINVSPAKWVARDMGYLLDTAAKLQAMALGGPPAEARGQAEADPGRARPDADPEIFAVVRLDDSEGADAV